MELLCLCLATLALFVPSSQAQSCPCAPLAAQIPQGQNGSPPPMDQYCGAVTALVQCYEQNAASCAEFAQMIGGMKQSAAQMCTGGAGGPGGAGGNDAMATMMECGMKLETCAGGQEKDKPSEDDVMAEMDKWCPKSKQLMTCAMELPEKCATFIESIKTGFGAVQSLCEEQGYWESAKKAVPTSAPEPGTTKAKAESTVKYSEANGEAGNVDDNNGASAVAASLVVMLTAAMGVTLL